jgi:hypothetical protein
MINYILLPFLVGGSLYSNVKVPLFVSDGVTRIKLQPRFLSGTVGDVGLYILALELRISRIAHSNADDWNTALSFIDGNENTVVAIGRTFTAPSYIPDREIFGVSPDSQIYNDFPNGFLMISESSTDLSMVVNPQNIENFCQQDSLFYIGISTDEFQIAVETIVIPNESQDSNFEIDSSAPMIQRFSVSASELFDSFPEHVIDQLTRYINPGGSSPRLPTTIENCNLSEYPAIGFRIGEFNSDSQFQHIGNVIYAPDDYMEYVSDTDCRFKIRYSETGGVFGENFLSKVAVHLRPDRIGFCDPADQ